MATRSDGLCLRADEPDRLVVVRVVEPVELLLLDGLSPDCAVDREAIKTPLLAITDQCTLYVTNRKEDDYAP